ncbi:MAG TPA: NAD(P)H-hydrate dehydratase [Thermoplasmatales archaeon]|nr:NAD(P)H-hydrate dehydratase [Thermoplasmatales archaeon]
MLTAKDVKVLDLNSEFFGVPTETLMENAGKGVADFVVKKRKPRVVTVFCGLGNNGGDGFVAARHLSKHCGCNVVVMKDPGEIKTPLAKKNFERLKNVNVFVYVKEDKSVLVDLLKNSDVVVDAMLGVGLSGELREPYKSCVEILNKEKKKFFLVSVDVPTGFGTNLSLNPDATVTFHDLKEGMNRENCGEIEVVDIGIPEEAKVYVGPGELKVYYPRNKSGSHKGDNGVVLVVGGGPYVGAPVLSAVAALRTGVDLVYLATPKRVAEAVYSLNADDGVKKNHTPLLLNLIVKELSEKDKFVTKDLNLLSDLLDRVDTVVVGPGLGKHDETKEAVKKLLIMCREKNVSCVIDADALGVVGENKDVVEGIKAVVTPHAGEFFRLTGEKVPGNVEDAEDVVREWAEKLRVTIVLKGAEDIISDGIRVKRNRVHHPAMTVGGTGDVLSGVIGALLSKCVSPFLAGCIGTFLNGFAGLKAFDKYSYGLVATDVVEEIPLVLKQFL